MRVVTLLYDLVTEKMFAEEEAELTQESSPEKLQQYRQVHLLPGLREQGWCEITAHLLALPEHDARERCYRRWAPSWPPAGTATTRTPTQQDAGQPAG